MKILYVNSYFLPHIGGVEYYTYYLCKEMKKLGQEVSVISSGKSRIVDGIRVRGITSLKIMGCPVPLNPRIFRKAISEEKPDIIHTHFPHPGFLEAATFFASRKKIPLVITSHGNLEPTGAKKIILNSYNMVYGFCLKKANRIVTATDKIITSFDFLYKHKKKIAIIPHGIDPEKFKNLENIPKNKEENILLFVGALKDYKGIKYLICSLPRVIREFPNTNLIIIGKGERRGMLERLAKNLGVRDKIIFKPHLSEEEILKQYQMCDVFILPSPTIEESYGLVALEACAVGKPVIVAGAGISEVFRKENIGIVVNPRDPEDIAEKILHVLRNPEKGFKIGRKARKAVLEKYTWDKKARRYLDVYEGIKRRKG